MSLFQVSSDSVISVHGHLDRETLSDNWWAILSSKQQQQLQDSGQCTFDLADVERVDSAGLAWLINAIRDARQHQIKVRLTEVPHKLLKLAKISDVDGLLPVE